MQTKPHSPQLWAGFGADGGDLRRTRPRWTKEARCKQTRQRSIGWKASLQCPQVLTAGSAHRQGRAEMAKWKPLPWGQPVIHLISLTPCKQSHPRPWRRNLLRRQMRRPHIVAPTVTGIMTANQPGIMTSTTATGKRMTLPPAQEVIDRHCRRKVCHHGYP